MRYIFFIFLKLSLAALFQHHNQARRHEVGKCQILEPLKLHFSGFWEQFFCVTVYMKFFIFSQSFHVLLVQKQSPEVFCKKNVFLKISQNSRKETQVQVIFCEFCEMFRNTFFIEYLMIASISVDSCFMKKLFSAKLKEV